jgi:anti-sigma-K factor RskA
VKRTYTGWKAALTAIAVTFVVFAALNLLYQANRDRSPKRPLPVVTTVSP